jgi:predicted AlkP superfamily phosphohydrolase/phosphomutase
VSDPARLIVLGFDATPGRLVRGWADAGELPVLKRLMDAGASAALESPAWTLPEGIWPSIVTGCEAGSHGMYGWREIAAGTYERRRRPLGATLPPFWETAGRRSVLLDVQGATANAGPGAVVVSGWGLRGAAPHERESSPPGELGRVVGTYGPYAANLNREVSGRPLLERSQLRSLLRMTERRTEIMLDLMSRHPWDVCATIFYEAHWAGHAFHRYAERDDYIEPVPRGRGLGDALLRLYRGVDAGIGRLIDAAPEGTHVAVLSGMGLRPNTNGVTLLPRALEALGYTVPAAASPGSRGRELARRVALTVVPRPLARAVRRRFIDSEAIERHMEKLWLESTDWARTRAWSEAEQGTGYVRLNVVGREPAGIVQPGREYDELCAQLAADLLELRLVGSDRPAVEQVVRRSEITTGGNEERVPDLFVRWSRTDVVRRAYHPRVGVVEDDGSDWQATEHDDDAWLVLAGPRVRSGASTKGARVEDVAPTALQLIGADVPAHMDGRPLAELIEPPGDASKAA